jgi:hypothetical protein
LGAGRGQPQSDQSCQRQNSDVFYLKHVSPTQT